MMKLIRQQFEIVDFLIIGFHTLALFLLAPYWRSVDHFGMAAAQSLTLIGITLFCALRLTPAFPRLATCGRILVCCLSAPWGYERANAAVRIFWGDPPALEPYFIAVDHMLFSGNPSEWMQSIQTPILTEWLQACYLMYFVIPLTIVVVLCAANRWKDVSLVLFATILATHQNFIWYVLVPVRSPFLVTEELGHLISYDTELIGLWVTDSLRRGLLDATTFRHDCFPSGHTTLTLVSMALAWRLHRKLFWFLFPVASSLVFSTIYLRYHYLIDVIAGFVVASLVVWVVFLVCPAWERKRAEALGEATARAPMTEPN